MSIPEPPINADDTHHNRSWLLSRHLNRMSCALLTVIGMAAISLCLLLVILWHRSSVPDQDRLIIFLRIDGEQRTIHAQAGTVAGLLQSEQVVLTEQDHISPPLAATLSPDLLIDIVHARTVTVTVDQQSQTLQTPHDNPLAILEQAQITVDADDLIWVDGSQASRDELAQWTVPANSIIVQHRHPITVRDGDQEYALQTTAATVGEALYQADISVYLTDTLSHDVDSPIENNMLITIERARPIRIIVDGTIIETRVQGATVADALAESGIALVGLDYSMPALNDRITPETSITVLRVTEDMVTTDTTIPYETRYQADATLELDQQRIVQAGQTAIERLTERVRYENGVEIAREPISTEIVQAGQTQIIAYGTTIVVRSIETPEGTRDYWRQLRVYATSYHPEALGGDNVTAIGETLRFGIIGANPDIIAYRTMMYVPGYGIGMMADTGGARSSPYWIDLGYSDHDYVGWHQYVDVYLLTPIPDNVDYLLPDVRPMRGLPDNG